MHAALCLALFAALLLLAALEDLRTRRIPNWLVLAVGVVWLPWSLAGPASGEWPAAFLLALGSLLAGALLFARGILGGGDVKLITAVILWAGLPHLALFTFVMSLTGGLLAMMSLAWQRYGWMVVPLLVPLQPTFGPLRPVVREPIESAPRASAAPAPVTLPYGIAIAAGGLAVALQHLKSI